MNRYGYGCESDMSWVGYLFTWCEVGKRRVARLAVE
jgi:hypothetical protein